MDLQTIAEPYLTALRAMTSDESAQIAEAALEVEAQGWEYWVRFFFGDSFTRPFTKYQQEFWEWGWGIEPDEYYRPRAECEPRGVGKSTNVQTWIVSLLARKRRRAIGYVSREAMKATQHYAAIKRKLENPKLLEYYPHLKPRVQVLRGAMEQWSSEAIVTEAGQMTVPISLLGSKRGFKSKEDVRFDVVVLDDIDDLKESPELRAKNLELLKSDIIAAGNDTTLFVFAQNLIHRDSICAQVLDHRADILSDRVFKGPFPLMKWYEAEKVQLEDGARQWKITAGEVFDPAIPIQYSERLLNKFGKKTFDRECQQLTNIVDEENDFREWDEVYHIATRSEVLAGFAKYKQNLHDEHGNLRWPDRFHKGKGLDWGTTPKHPSACVFATRPAETYAFSDIYFVFGEVVLPKYPYDAHVEAEVVSPGRVAKAIRDFMAKWHIREFEYQRMSHEASAALNAFIIDMPEDLKVWFQKWKAQKGSGVPQTQRLMEIDPKRPHPFRRYPVGHLHEGRPLPGCPRIIFVVEDGQGELYVDDIGRLRVIGATDSEGLARLRYEIPIYNHRNQAEKKVDDDAVDGMRGLLSVFAPSADGMDYEEKVQATIPEGHRLEDQKEQHPQGVWITPEAELDYAYNLTRAKQILAGKGGSVQRFDRFGRRVS